MATTPAVASQPQKLPDSELLFQAAQKMSLQPDWVTPNGLMAISVDGQERYINRARSSLNSLISANLTRNKFLTRRILARHDIENIPFAKPKTLAEAKAFLTQHVKIIVKPIDGTDSRDIHIITKPVELEAFESIHGYILEKYIAGKEFRYLILEGAVIAVHRSDYGTSVQQDRYLERVSYPEIDWDPALIASSLQVAAILGLKFAAVDYMVEPSGHAYVLEVNSSPGLKWFHAPTSGPSVDVASQFLAATVKQQ